MTTGSGSDPHLLGLLRAIRLRQSAPDAAAAGAADVAAALSEPPVGKDRAGQTGPGTEAPGNEQDRPRNEPPVTDATAEGAGEPEKAPPVPEKGPTAFWVRAAAAAPGPIEASRPVPPPPPAGAPGQGATSELLWRGDQGAALGRAGLEPGTRRTPAAGGKPARPVARTSWGDRVNPVAGTNPAGPAIPVPTVPRIPGIRPIGSPGTEFPPISQQVSPGHGPRRAPSVSPAGAPGVSPTRVPGKDGMDPGDDAALLVTQRLLSTSLTFAGGTGEVADRLWVALLQAQPDLLAVLPGTEATQRRQLARALAWLVHTFDQPPAMVAGCGQFGAALAECGVQWNQLQLVGAALAEAMRAGMPPGVWRQDFDEAWRWTWKHTYEWLVHGGTLIAYQPTVWQAEVVAHEQRRPDLAVVRIRPFLPMPYRPGQFTRIEVPQVPGVWRPYSIGCAPHQDDVIELHVRAKTDTGVSGTLVHHTREGDRVRLTRAEGEMGVPTDRSPMLMIAQDTGVAPMKAMLADLANRKDNRSAVLFWGARTRNELYDIAAVGEVAAMAPRVTVVPVISEGPAGPYASGLVTDAVAAYGEWSRHEVYLAGPPLMLAATVSALRDIGVPSVRIHHDPAD
ncbi:flavohemoprotein [Actinoplanes sp. NPDC051851]|uniref:flavohemoprotein n=1 Tax=Actinoplanes sp. NPDC051851 TaxID=3154753 RepID=UPI00344A432C